MHGSLQKEFSAKIESCAAAMQDMIEKRLEEKLSSFQQQLQALISHATSTASGSSSGGSGHHTDMDTFSPGSLILRAPLR